MNNIIKFYIIISLGLLIGIVVGLLMIYFNVVEYEVIFTTSSACLTLAILYNQHDFGSNHMPKKQWQINLGLIEGYDMNSKTHDINDVHLLYKNWIIQRRRDKKPIVSGSVQYEHMIYPFDDNAIIEPSAIIKGELSPKFDKYRKDYEVLDTLQNLVEYLLINLGQNRVYYSYLDVQYTFDKKDVNHNKMISIVS